jgi:8-oxo-dGTP diphosphatase
VKEGHSPTLGVGAIVVVEDRLLMVQRGHDPGKGLWSVPGGKVEYGEYLTDALRREVKEETGLDVSIKELAGFFEVHREDLHYVVMDFHASPTDDAVPVAGDDVDAVEWVPFEDISRRDCTPRLIELLTSWGVLRGGGGEGDEV